MNSIQFEKTEKTEKTKNIEKKEKPEKKERHRPTPIKVDGIFTWDQKKSKYDPPSPPNKNKIRTNYASFFNS